MCYDYNSGCLELLSSLLVSSSEITFNECDVPRSSHFTPSVPSHIWRARSALEGHDLLKLDECLKCNIEHQCVILEQIGLDPQDVFRSATTEVTLDDLVAVRMLGIRQRRMDAVIMGQRTKKKCAILARIDDFRIPRESVRQRIYCSPTTYEKINSADSFLMFC